MTVKVNHINHPLLNHKLSILRDENTDSPLFRKLMSEIVPCLVYEATRELGSEKIDVKTPICSMKGSKIGGKTPLAIPVLRAGLGMLDGVLQIIPKIEIGFLGVKRDEKTLQPYTYAKRLPQDLKDRTCYLLDPMLATGNTTNAAINFLTELGAKNIVSINILAAPEGIETVKAKTPDDINLSIVVPAIDEKLNKIGYIVPGLGDAGDRLYGVID